MSSLVKKSINKVEANPFIITSDTLTEENPIIILHGTYGSGKTTTMCSASNKFPDVLPAKRHVGPPKHILNDMFVISFDRGGLGGLKERGIQAPNVFDVFRFIALKDQWSKAKFAHQPTIFQAVEFGLNQAAKLIANGDITWLGVDTVSSFDKALDGYYHEKMPYSKSSGEPDTRWKYGQIFMAHKQFYGLAVSLGCGIIFCCHSKAYMDERDMDEYQKSTKLTLTTSGMPSVVPDITGKGAGIYKANASLELVLLTTQNPQTRRLDRYAYTVVTKGFEAKNRYELSLDPKEEPHIQKIMAKVRAK